MFPEALASRLAKLDIRNATDLILHLPLRYEDETQITPIQKLCFGIPAQVEAVIIDTTIQNKPRRQLICRVFDASGELTLRFLNFYPSQIQNLQAGRTLRIFGELRSGLFPDMVHPRYRLIEPGEPLPLAMTPIYPTTAGLSQLTLRKLIGNALAEADLTEILPASLLKHLNLASFTECIRILHHPTPEISLDQLTERTHPAWQRIKFDELLAQQLCLRQTYLTRRLSQAPMLASHHSNGDSFTQKLLANLPFQLTRAQERVWTEISQNMTLSYPMQRLLQGDVGSGKTVIAALAMLQAVENGYQAALMAPTEILAEQHWRKLSQWLAPMDLDVAWLSGSLKKKEKQAIITRLAEGKTLLAVGTHALIEEIVDFPRLGLAIVDEQHRFGVRQRLALREKTKNNEQVCVPHQLMMSATPIPRTLAMSYYSDLDVSVIDALPPGRTPVLTKLLSDTRRDEVMARVKAICASGRQAYWVCPLIEESETLQLQTALDTFEHLKAALAFLRIGLVHGRLPTAEKATVMAAFAAGQLDVLVATTVIEVGVDVPNASLMVIEHAERFGLAQLHQLRGRVGRGAHESACILLYAHPLSALARARLKTIYEHQDGFEIARQDLALRGPGEFVGSRQSGVPLLRFANLETDQALLEAARETAHSLLRDHPEAAQAHRLRWLGNRQDYIRV